MAHSTPIGIERIGTRAIRCGARERAAFDLTAIALVVTNVPNRAPDHPSTTLWRTVRAIMGEETAGA
jgi:hypothetical protein